MGLKMKPSQPHKRQHYIKLSNGFTLIEVMIVVAIMGLITVAAWPSYDRYQTKNRRADGISGILIKRTELEKCYASYAGSANHGYNGGKCDTATKNSSEGHYSIAVTNLAAETYTLTATPQGAQTDPECTVLTLTHLGVKGFTNTNTGSDPKGSLQRCWSQ